MTDHQHTADTLNRAADLIEERGWTQGTGWIAAIVGEGPLCIEGAVMAVAGTRLMSQRRQCPAHQAVRSYLNDAIPFHWNDAEGRTAAEVIEVLRAAAVIEQARADEHTATDMGYDTAAEMRSVADDAAARTLAALR